MADPTIQWLFDTQIVEGTLATEGMDDARLIATAIALAERYTADVARPAVARFTWVGALTAITAPQIVTAPGAFYVLAVARGDDGSRLVLDDPRMAVAAIPPDMRFTQPGGVAPGTPEVFASAPGGFVLYPAILRAEIVGPRPACDSAIVSLYPQRR